MRQPEHRRRRRLGHIGFSYNGDIEHNTVLFNQSTNPTIATNGGGILVMGAPDVDPTCGVTTDQDCVSTRRSGRRTARVRASSSMPI